MIKNPPTLKATATEAREVFVDVAKKSFQTEVVSGDPFAKVVSPAFLEKVLHDTGPEFAVAMGVALRRLQELD